MSFTIIALLHTTPVTIGLSLCLMKELYVTARLRTSSDDKGQPIIWDVPKVYLWRFGRVQKYIRLVKRKCVYGKHFMNMTPEPHYAD
jgi:hypothetical protein